MMQRYTSEWHERAACRDEDPELFFPLTEMGPGADQAQRAKEVCARCPVQAECLNFALDNRLDHGIFGGHTAEERRELTRRRPVSGGARSGTAD